MKKAVAMVMTAAILVSVVIGSTGCASKKKDEWYKGALAYYGEGVKNGFAKEDRQLVVAGDLKDKSNKCGYLLKDLDGDGVEELLIGLIDNGIETRFTSVVVRHRDLGPYCLLSAGGGNYIYLCADNVLKMDSTFGSSGKNDYLKWNSRSNSFSKVEGEGKYLPLKWELTAF